jgi:AcrR family transcriptional regulator
MEKVAREVKVTTMAVYRYLPNKQALIELMIENVATDGPDLETAKGWRHKLTAWMRACRSMYGKHPWLLPATLGPRTMGPSELRWLDSALGILAEAGVSASQRHDIFLVLIGHIRSNAEFESVNSRGGGLQWDTTMLLREYREKLPSLAQAIEAGAFPSRGNQGFDVGLNCILSGIETITRKRKGERRIRPAAKLHAT